MHNLKSWKEKKEEKRIYTKTWKKINNMQKWSLSPISHFSSSENHGRDVQSSQQVGGAQNLYIDAASTVKKFVIISSVIHPSPPLASKYPPFPLFLSIWYWHIWIYNIKKRHTSNICCQKQTHISSYNLYVCLHVCFCIHPHNKNMDKNDKNKNNKILESDGIPR